MQEGGKRQKTKAPPELVEYIRSRLLEMFKQRAPEFLQDRGGDVSVNQSKVAEAHESIAQSTIGRLFKKPGEPTLGTIAAVAPVFGMDAVELFCEIFAPVGQRKIPTSESARLLQEAQRLLPEKHIDWLAGKARTLIEAQQMLRENPELYDLLAGGEDDHK